MANENLATSVDGKFVGSGRALKPLIAIDASPRELILVNVLHAVIGNNWLMFRSLLEDDDLDTCVRDSIKAAFGACLDNGAFEPFIGGDDLGVVFEGLTGESWEDFADELDEQLEDDMAHNRALVAQQGGAL